MEDQKINDDAINGEIDETPESTDAVNDADDADLAEPDTSDKPKKKGKKGKDKDKEKEKDKDAGRGIETMFRTALRNHISLSQIADSKANIMLTINGGIMAFTFGSLFPRFDAMPVLVLPSLVLTAVCISALVFAVISTIPKVTSGKVSKQDVLDKKANLLFFGNFYKMELDEFQWGLSQMMKDKEFLYSAMIRDFYNLGLVLAVKYKYLRICYMIFMWGMIASVMIFALTFGFNLKL